MKLTDDATKLLIGTRIQKDMSIKKAASLIEVDRTTYSRYEKSNFENINPAQLSIICNELHINILDVLLPELKNTKIDIDSILSDLLLFQGYDLSIRSDGTYNLKFDLLDDSSVINITKEQKENLLDSLLDYIDYEVNKLKKQI